MKNTKTQKHKNRIKILIPMLLLVFASSCEKEKVEAAGTKTVADFEKIMANDKDILAFNKITDSLVLLNSINTIPTLANNYSPKNIPISSEDIAKLNKIQNKEELVSFLTAHSIDQSSKIVDLAFKQRNHLNSFLKRNAKFKDLLKEDKFSLLQSARLINNTNSINTRTDLAPGPDICGQGYMKDLSNCDDDLSFNINMTYAGGAVAIIAGIVATGGIGAAITGPAVDAVILGVIGCYLIHGKCISRTVDDYYICIGQGALVF